MYLPSESDMYILARISRGEAPVGPCGTARLREAGYLEPGNGGPPVLSELGRRHLKRAMDRPSQAPDGRCACCGLYACRDA